jgi:hypothetical protein
MQTVIGFEGDDRSDYRIIILNHAVEKNLVIVDQRSSLFGSYSPVHRDALVHRVEGDELDEGLDGVCRCCRNSVDAADGDQTDANVNTADHEMCESRLHDLQERYDRLLLTMGARIDELLLQRDAAERQMIGLRAELQRLEAVQRDT